MDLLRCAALAGLFNKCTVSIRLLNWSSDITTASSASRRAIIVSSASLTTPSKTLFSRFRASEKVTTFIEPTLTCTIYCASLTCSTNCASAWYAKLRLLHHTRFQTYNPPSKPAGPALSNPAAAAGFTDCQEPPDDTDSPGRLRPRGGAPRMVRQAARRGAGPLPGGVRSDTPPLPHGG